jgi:hypothetical protein
MKNCNYFTFKHDAITCPKCNWTGQGSYIAEFQCPKCVEEIGFVQFPMKEEVKNGNRRILVRKQDVKCEINAL